jgi:hypothetical protein
MIPVQNAQEANLAWALIAVVKPNMSAGERNYAFVAIGAGDTFAAIRGMINQAAAKRIPLPPHLVQVCTTWLDAYALHEEYDRLRRVIEGFLMPDAIRASTAIRRLATTPHPEPLPAVPRPVRTRGPPLVQGRFVGCPSTR